MEARKEYKLVGGTEYNIEGVKSMGYKAFEKAYCKIVKDGVVIRQQVLRGMQLPEAWEFITGEKSPKVESKKK